ncbi:TetR/AcrR family transcriptional regulator [Achromobacter deleyi]|uniref:TetR/AcrR family transcriptional regulator n=1 Tax=Achromobacter deleyi TaxID=1353891 RepID=A0A7T4E137_9BURK|nr:TetR family transcriptional regulator [Achromobacter deleyi]QQB33113.1 TetR/AcrR family transcriptional regulator [Achromobacter deleyi]
MFANNGYGGTSTEELRAAMGIGRQSFYDTFVSKHALYVEALQRYNRDQATQIVEDLHSGSTLIEGISKVLSSFVDRCENSPSPVCLGTSAICEFGRRDSAITESSEVIAAILLKPLVSAIQRAKEANEVRRDIDPDVAAHFLLSSLAGLKVSARAGMPPDQLRKIGCLALQAFT